MENIDERLKAIEAMVEQNTIDYGEREECTIDANEVYWLLNKIDQLREKVKWLEMANVEFERHPNT